MTLFDSDPDIIDELVQSVNDIETELGLQPEGVYASVRTRLDILEARINNPFAPAPNVNNPFFIGGSPISGVSIQAGFGDPGLQQIPAIPGSLYLREDGYSTQGLYAFRPDGYWHLVDIEPSQSFTILPIEISFTSGVFSTGSATFQRFGSRALDMSKYPISIGALDRTIKFVANVDMTAGATSVEVKLVDITHFVDITNTDLLSTSPSNTEVTSVALAVGSGSGNIRNDVVATYEVDVKMNGGTMTDHVFITNARLIITYS